MKGELRAILNLSLEDVVNEALGDEMKRCGFEQPKKGLGKFG